MRVSITRGALHASDPYLFEIHVHDIGAMPRALQPALHDAVDGALARGNIFATPAHVVARVGDAFVKRRAVSAFMIKKIVLHHVLRMRSCRVVQLVVPGERRGRSKNLRATCALSSTRIVHQYQQVV